MVVVGPMPRYVTDGCCQESDHVTNRTRPEFYAKMKDDLAACGTTIKDFLFSGLRNGRVMDPGRQLRGLAAAEIWGTDPVHPKKEVYGLLADGVIEVERACGSGRAKTRANSGDVPPYCCPPRRQRGGLPHKRLDTRTERRQQRGQFHLAGRWLGTRR